MKQLLLSVLMVFCFAMIAATGPPGTSNNLKTDGIYLKLPAQSLEATATIAQVIIYEQKDVTYQTRSYGKYTSWRDGLVSGAVIQESYILINSQKISMIGNITNCRNPILIDVEKSYTSYYLSNTLLDNLSPATANSMIRVYQPDWPVTLSFSTIS